MKKLTHLLMMLCVFAGTAWAGPTDLPLITTDLENPIYYTIYNTRSTQPGGLMYYAGDGVGMKDGCTSPTLENKYKFYFTGSHDALYVHNAATSKKLASVGDGNKSKGSWTDEGTVWAVGVSPKGGGLAFGPKGGLNGNGCWNECNYDTGAGNPDFTTWSANDDGSIFVVELASEYTFPETGKFYTIECPLFERVQGVKKGLYVNENNALAWGTVDLTNKNHYWVPTVNVDNNTVALKNLGTGKYLNGTDMADAMADATIKALGSNQFNIVVNSTTVHANGHNSGNGAGSNIVSWEGALNSASAWTFVEQADPDAAKQVTIKYSFTYNGEVKYTQETNTLVGQEYPAFTVAFPYGVSADKPVGNVTADGAVDDVKTVEIDLNIERELPFKTATSVDEIDTWYYARMHTNQPGYIGDIDTDNTINVYKDKYSDTFNENFIWGFVGDVFSGITIVNKGTGKQLTSTGEGNATLTDEGTAFFVAHTSETSANAANGFCLRKKDSNNYLNANYSAGKLAHWHSTDAGSTMFLTEYNEDEVVVSETAGYATLYLGYTTYIPKGVEVYAITGINGAWATMTAVEGVLPANTGVILKNAGNYTFKGAAANGSVEGNLLCGSVEDTYVAGAAYVLANGENGVGLYKAELNKNAEGNAGDTHFKNNAKKAYLPDTASAGVRFLSFGFGDNETAIENIEGAEVENAVVYDLAGRRVQKAQKGLYIVNGKKVIK